MTDSQGLSTSNDKNRHIYEYLNYYLSLPYAPHYAVLISGQWGIGKTYLVKRFLQKHFDKDKRYVYVSLYGLETIDDIDAALFQALYPIISKVAAVGTRLGTLLLKHFGIDTDIKVGARDLINARDQPLYVFDDLERCEAPLNKALGYINEFVEHEGAKVIIVANEQSIGGAEDFGQRREKLIGKTLEVQSAFEEAFAYFNSSISSPDAKHLFEKNAGEIATIYEQSRLGNLRILQQTMWDFERFFRALSDKHRHNADATKTLLRLFFALSFELKAGKISAQDLETRTDRIMHAVDQQEGRAKSALTKAEKRYPEIDLADSILSNGLLIDTLVKGLVDSQAICAELDRSRYFVSFASEPAWRTFWHWSERPDAQVMAAQVEMERQFFDREFILTGEILHVMGLRLLSSDIGVLKKTRKEIVLEGKLYIDDLYAQGQLEQPPSFGHSDASLLFGGYAGLAFQESNTQEHRELREYLQQKQQQAVSDSLPKKAENLLIEMQSDSRLFFRRLCLTNSEDNLYYDTPILCCIDPDIFVDALLKVAPGDQRMILMALMERYQNGRLAGSLAAEKPWLTATKDKLIKRAANLSLIGRYRLNRFIDSSITAVLL